MEFYINQVLRWRYLVIVLMIALAALAASGGRFLEFKNDYRMFFSDDNPQLQAFEHLQTIYPKNDNVLFVLAPQDGQVFTTEVLSAIETLTQQAWRIPYSSRVDSLSNFQHSYAAGDDLVVEDLVRDAQGLGQGELDDIRQTALNDPLLVNRLIAPQGDVTGINVTLQLPGVNPGSEVPEVAAFVRDLRDRLRAEHADIDVYLTGSVMMDNAFPEASEQDLKTLVPLMLVLVVLLVGLLLRAVAGTLITVLVIVLSILPAMGLAGWLGIALSPTSVAAPNIILTLAVADCVHILVSFFHSMRNGADKRAAIRESLRINFQPVFLTSFTTAIGFLSMNMSDAPPFRDLGNITAMGVGVAFLLAVTLLPALLMVLPVRVRQQTSLLDRHMQGFADWVIKRRNLLLWGMLGTMVVLVAFIPKNELNDEFVKYFDDSVEFRQATDFTFERLTGLYYIDYSLDSGETDGLSDPAFLERVDRFAEWYRSQPEVLHVYALTDIFKRLNKNLHADQQEFYRLPETRALAAQYLLLYEMSLPYGLDLNDRLDTDKSATRLSVTLRNVSSKQVLDLEQRADQWLQQHLVPPIQFIGSSPAIMFAHIGQRNIESMLLATLLALVLISATLMITLRSLKIGLISILPNLLPAAMAFGLWGLFVGRVGLALSVVAAMTLGVIVDDTVHFLSKYLRARRERSLAVQAAVRYAFSTVGTALVISSLVLMVGFLTLAFSSYEINAGMGLLTAIVIAMALLADFLFLPPLLIKMEDISHEKATVPSSIVEPSVL